jgi:hypothetical protein
MKLPTQHAWTLPAYNNRRDLLLQPFAEAVGIAPTEQHLDEMYARVAHGMTREEFIAVILDEYEWPLFRNDLYQVQVRWDPDTMKLRRVGRGVTQFMPDLIHLSIKFIDKAPVHDWRHLQEIKSRIVGPQFEGIELYPAEDRVVDTANQYHLWVFGDLKAVGMIGFAAGVRDYTDNVGNARQRRLG